MLLLPHSATTATSCWQLAVCHHLTPTFPPVLCHCPVPPLLHLLILSPDLPLNLKPTLICLLHLQILSPHLPLNLKPTLICLLIPSHHPVICMQVPGHLHPLIPDLPVVLLLSLGHHPLLILKPTLNRLLFLIHDPPPTSARNLLPLHLINSTTHLGLVGALFLHYSNNMSLVNLVPN